MAQQIVTIDSESLEAAYRALTPAQQGFTEDLMASNTIIPVLDLTSSAQGTTTPEILQTALAFGSQTAFEANNASTVVANTAGFYRIFAGVAKMSSTAATVQANFTMTDGVTTKTVWGLETPGFINSTDTDVVDFVVFLGTGESISAVTDNADCFIKGSVRQIADVNGVLVNPSGFTPQ